MQKFPSKTTRSNEGKGNYARAYKCYLQAHASAIEHYGEEINSEGTKHEEEVMEITANRRRIAWQILSKP